MTVKLKKPMKREAEEEEEVAASAGDATLDQAGEVPGADAPGEPDTKEAPGAPDVKEAPSAPEPAPKDQHHFLRSCVRPHSKRQRRDSYSNGRPATTTTAKTKGSDGAIPSTPSVSAGSTPSTTKASRGSAPSAGEKDDGGKKKVRRQWESWSTEDKTTFFEALFEYGKDFEAIQNNVALKYKKKAKPASMVKNKEQIRHFYYRTWHKISKYIDINNVFTCGLKKSSQELYGLICYGELRKKIGGCLDDKNAVKLNELIQLGTTTVRHKGRNLKIKVPMCRALKKLFDPEGKTGVSDEEDQKPVRLPLKVPIELQPRNNQAWARVQSLAQNPRLRMIVELHRKVSCLIEFLKQKWALQDVRIRKSLDDQQLAEVEDSKEELHLFPPESAQLSSLPGVARVAHSKTNCTVRWQESGKCKQSSRDILLSPAHMLGLHAGQGAGLALLRGRGSTDAKQATKSETGSNASADRTVTVENGSAETVASDGVSNGPKTPVESPPESMDTSVTAEAPSDVLGNEPPLGHDPPTPGNEPPAPESDPPAPGRDPPAPGTDLPTPGNGPPAPGNDPSTPVSDPPTPGNDLPMFCSEPPVLGNEPPVMGSEPAQELLTHDPVPPSGNSDQDLVAPEGSPALANALKSPPLSPNINIRTSSEAASPSQDKAEVRTDNPPQENGTTQTSGTDSQGKEQNVSSKATPNQPTEQPRHEGWNQRSAENLTLAEVYLMLGKPGKLQLEYEWIDPSSSDDPESPLRHKQRLLSCLLRLIATEVNHRNLPEKTSVATSPMKQPVPDQTFTPPGKVIALLSHNPNCLRTQPAHLHPFSPPPSTSGFRNISRPLVFGGPLTTSSDGAVFAVPTMLPPNSRHNKVTPNNESEAAGRQHLDTINSELFLQKSKKPKNRHLRKPLVVQRTLLPRPSGTSLPQGLCSFSIMSNSAVAGSGSFQPIHSTVGKAVSHPVVGKGLGTSPGETNSLASAIDLAAKTAGIIPGPSLPVLETNGLVGIGPLPSDSLAASVAEPITDGSAGQPIPTVTVCPEVPFISLTTPPVQESAQPFQPSPLLSLPHIPHNPLQNGPPEPSTCPPSRSCLSPPNVSALLDISLPGPPDDVLCHGEPATHISDSIIEIAIGSGQFGEAVPLSPAKLGENSKSLPSPSSSPQQSWIASPSHDPQWYPNDSTDSTLSSLFSSFISPDKSKKTAPMATGNASGTLLLGPSLLDGSSRDSFVSRSLSDVEVVDSQLACLLNENSIDYISRFSDLAQELSASSDPLRRDPPFEAGVPGTEQPIQDM